MTMVDGTEEITELEKISPERVDAVNGPASGFPILMLKAAAAGTEAAPDQTQKAVALVPDASPQAPEATAQDAPPEPEVRAPEAEAEAVKSAPDPGMVNVDIPAGASVSISPADLAKLATLRQRLTLEQAALAKRDMDPDVGGGVDRDKLPASAFVFPETRDFPVVTPGDVSDAASSWGRYKGKEPFSAFKSKLTALARRKGPKFAAELPKSWTDGSAAKAGRQCPDCGTFAKADGTECGECGKAMEKAKGKGGKKKPFPGAAAPFKADKDGDGEPHEGKDGNGPAGKAAACKCGHMMAKGDKFCAGCGSEGGKGEAAKAAFPADAKVGAAISALEAGAEAALDAQAKDPDSKTHPADAKVEAELERVKADVEAAAAAQAEDERTDTAAGHAEKSAPEPPAYHLARLHDATCAAYRHEDVVITHPAAAKGAGELVDPSAFAGMVSAVLTADGGTGTRAHEIPSLSSAYHAAVTLKALAAQPEALAEAMDGLRKAFAGMYPTAHPTPGGISPGEFRRPYVSAGRASQSAKPGQEPRVPLASHVPEASDFRRPLITAGREAASPGSDPRPSGMGKARSYYTNAARDGAAQALTSMHDWIADNHPDVCPMTGVTCDGEPGRPNSMGSSLSTAQPFPASMAAKDKAVPVPVSPASAAAVVTPAVTKAERKAARAARKAAVMAQATEAPEAIAGTVELTQAPLIDPDLLKGILREVVAEQLGDVIKANGDLAQRIADLESAPDPAQMAPRSGAGLAKTADRAEVPERGDGHQAERLARLVKRAKDPDSGVRTAAIGELIETAGREAAVQLLEAAY